MKDDLPTPVGQSWDHSAAGTAWWRLSCGTVVWASAHGVYGAPDDCGFDHRSLDEIRFDALVALAAVAWSERAAAGERTQTHAGDRPA